MGFIFIGQNLLIVGYQHKEDESFDFFTYYCGEKLGKFYSILIPITITLIMSVLISGVGATFFEYYGVNKYIGSAIVMAIVLFTYLLGFEKLVKVISTVGPAIIIFSILVGIITIINDYKFLSQVPKYRVILSETRAAPHWIISSLLYLSLNFLSGSSYFVNLGKLAQGKKDAKYGAILGAILVVVTIGITNTALLLNAKDIVHMEVPVSYLAKKISYLLGNIFSIVLVLGMFSSASAMMWSICHRFKRGGQKGNQLFAISIAIFVFVLSLFSFSQLMGIFYPLVGYIGLIFIISIIYKQIQMLTNS